MKKNIIILSFLFFLFSAFLISVLVEITCNDRLKTAVTAATDSAVSLIDVISPEIKTSFLKPDDIALLYSVERLSKMKNITEIFILDKDYNVVIHNDSSKWNKKYTDLISKNAVLSKTKLVQKMQLSNDVLYSVPINETSVLCTVVSLENIYDNFKIWKIKLYVFCLLLLSLITAAVYYMAKFFFLRPFNKAKKYLSLKEFNKKTIYSELVDMITRESDDVNSRLDDAGRFNQDLKELLNYILKSYLQHSDDIFAILDNSTKIIYCFDEDKILFEKQHLNTHIVNSTANAELIKNISLLIENPVNTKNMDIGNYKINIIPVKNEDDNLLGVLITGNFGK